MTTLFSVIAPSTRAHLQLLSRLSLALHEPRFRSAVTGLCARRPDPPGGSACGGDVPEAVTLFEGLIAVSLLIASVTVLFVSALATLQFARRPRAASAIGVAGAIAGCVLGFITTARVSSGRPGRGRQHRLVTALRSARRRSRSSLSAFFLAPLFGLGAAAAVYGHGYLGADPGRSPVLPWFAYNVLVASMALVVLVRSALLFLVAWEVMSVASYFLVVFDDERPGPRAAGSPRGHHLATGFLIALFLLLGRCAVSSTSPPSGAAGSAALQTSCSCSPWSDRRQGRLRAAARLAPGGARAAPSHVSALLSAVLVKMGIYGLLATLPFWAVRGLVGTDFSWVSAWRAVCSASPSRSISAI